MKFDAPYILTRHIPREPRGLRAGKTSPVESFESYPTIQMVVAVATRGKWPANSVLQLQQKTENGYRIVNFWSRTDLEHELKLATR